MTNKPSFIWTVTTLLGEFLFPPHCAGCGQRARFLCSRCFQTLECAEQRLVTLPNCSISSAYNYSGIIKKLIALYKYHGVIGVGEILARLLHYCLPLPPHDCITWVPLHSTKERVRGFNQTEGIAKELAKLTQKPALELLQKVRATTSQMSLRERSQRADNIANSIVVPPTAKQQLLQLLDGKKELVVLLIDDVFTTGATISHCAENLKKISASITVKAITIAHGQ